MSPSAARQRDLDEIEVHRIGRVSEPDRLDATIGDQRSLALDVRHVRRRQRRLTLVALGQSRMLRAVRRGQGEHSDALADLTAAIIVRDARQAKAVTTVGKTATVAVAKGTAPLTVFFVVLEILKLLFGG